jgi:hypothetical protein
LVKRIQKIYEKYNPTDKIYLYIDQNGNPLLEASRITNKWREYFKDLLNPMEANQYKITVNQVVTSLESKY